MNHVQGSNNNQQNPEARYFLWYHTKLQVCHLHLHLCILIYIFFIGQETDSPPPPEKKQKMEDEKQVPLIDPPDVS